MVEFKDSHYIVGPRSDAGDGAEQDDAGNHAERIEYRRERQDTQTNLGLHHQARGTEPTNLNMSDLVAAAACQKWMFIHYDSWGRRL